MPASWGSGAQVLHAPLVTGSYPEALRARAARHSVGKKPMAAHFVCRPMPRSLRFRQIRKSAIPSVIPFIPFIQAKNLLRTTPIATHLCWPNKSFPSDSRKQEEIGLDKGRGRGLIRI